ncbi:MAG: DUF5765 domain-containing protein [Gammaproteobacteria bacterium]
MCWSGEASGVLATIGLGASYVIAKKGESKELWMPLTYFALMELLQAATYVYIDECNNPKNQILTLFGYIHIAFQPFFANMVAMYFIPERIKHKIRTPVYAICAIGSIAILVKMFPFGWAGACQIGIEGFCGPNTCSVSGAWHIAWQLPLNGLLSAPIDWLFGFEWGLHALAYILVAFIMPILYGSWRFVGFHYLVGPWISDITTSDPNEYVAVWCLFSIALCLSVIKTPIRKYLHVKSWLFYKQVPERPADSL